MSETVNRLAALVGDAQPQTPDQSSADSPLELTAELIASARPFVGEWQTLESTTNWEKGRIIAAWRNQLEKAGSDATEFSDQAWAQLVGGVTSQHVGRLRRTQQRYGDVWREYAGLYWSHFYAALEWPDAEMWLEGAVQNGWSISKMRAQRWETLGDAAVGASDPDAEDADDEHAPLETDQAPADQSPATPWGEGEPSVSEPAVASQPRERSAQDDEADQSPSETHEPEDGPRPPRERPFAELPELPADVAEAFEQFKLVLLNHKLTGWQEIGRDDLVAVLESLKRLALAVDDPTS
ncbi:hypothetical protein Pla175_04630 [Pirellulimonas nuda]|uniref:Uncharacterized protein n=1 Tax=Pirellulimonas nuda TaxID=2528009 RepID=A0A518D6J3_9BACT|nr:hypothetical protein [Pirellulimonas nuda]QDU87108.1 hypothetical protein Pla175_04630 [Pirellulimonas nuda]